MIGRVNMVSGQVKTQLIAHDKEVYDIAFSKGKVKIKNSPLHIAFLLQASACWYIFNFFYFSAGGGRDMFASVGADGSVRMFDLRHLEHSTIIYEDPQHTPLLRLVM